MRPRAALLLLTAACARQATSSPAPEPVPAASPQEPVPSASSPEPVPTTNPPARPTPVPAASPLASAGQPSPTPAPDPPDPVPSASPSEPVPAPADPPLVALPGQPRATIEARLGRPRGESGGWSHYADVDLQYRKGRCTRLRRTAPATLDCADIPAWIGITHPVGHPLRRASTCEWPGISERHRLTDTLAASHDIATHRLEVWLRD